MTVPRTQLEFARLAAAWGVTAPGDAMALQNLLAAAPETVRRIERLASLLFDPADLPRWYLGIAWAGPIPADLFRQGPDGARTIEAELRTLFQPNAPPEAFDTDMVEPADFELCERIVMRLMIERAREGGRRAWTFVDPMSGRTHPRATEALAAAIWGCARRRDAAETRALVRAALGDRDYRIRTAAVRAAGRFLGFRDIREALADVLNDPVASVRLEIVRQLGRFSDIRDIRDMLFQFVNDFRKKIRLEALSWLLVRGLTDAEIETLVPLCFDPHRPIARMARTHIPAERVQAEIDRRVLALRSHAEMSSADLALMARCAAVRPALRTELFADRLTALAGTDRDVELAQTVRAIGYWDGKVPERLWSGILTLVDPARPLSRDLERALVMCLGQKRAPWPVLRAVLDHPGFGQSDALEQRFVEVAAESLEPAAAQADLAARVRDSRRTLPQRRRALRILARVPDGRAHIADLIGSFDAEDPLIAEANDLLAP